MWLWTDSGVVGTSGHSLTSGFSTLMLPPTRTYPFKSVIGNMKWRRSGCTNREFEKLNMPRLHPLFSQPVVDSARKQPHSTSVWPLPLLSIGTSPIAAPWTGWGVPSPSVSSDLPSSAYEGHGRLVVTLRNLVHQLIWWQQRRTLSQAEVTSANWSLLVSLWFFFNLHCFNPR